MIMADNEHTCAQEARIAVLEAHTAQQGDDIADIKQELKDLNKKVDKNHEEMNNELKQIRTDVSDIKTSIAAQSIKIDNLANTVKASVERIDKMHEKVEGIETSVNTHTTDINRLTSTTDDHGRRLDNVEKKLWKILAAIGAAIFILQLIGTMSSCSDIKHFVKQLLIEEQQVQTVQQQ